MNQTQGGGRLW